MNGWFSPPWKGCVLGSDWGEDWQQKVKHENEHILTVPAQKVNLEKYNQYAQKTPDQLHWIWRCSIKVLPWSPSSLFHCEACWWCWIFNLWKPNSLKIHMPRHHLHQHVSDFGENEPRQGTVPDSTNHSLWRGSSRHSTRMWCIIVIAWEYSVQIMSNLTCCNPVWIIQSESISGVDHSSCNNWCSLLFAVFTRTKES